MTAVRGAASVGSGLAPARDARPIREGERIHVVGAAGAGASAAALLAHSCGALVSGCDPGGPSPYTAALDAAGILAAVTPDVNLVFLCSPNNPTGGLLERAAVLQIARRLLGRAVVVVDEAYLEFAGTPSLLTEFSQQPNLVVLRTLSKAFGLAGVRCGVTLASPALIGVLQKIIAPYPIPTPVLQAALTAISPAGLAAIEQQS